MNTGKLANELYGLAKAIEAKPDPHPVNLQGAELLRALARIVQAARRPGLKKAGLQSVIRKAFPAWTGTPIGDALHETPLKRRGMVR